MDQGGNTYQEGARQVDEQRRGVLSTLPHLQQPVRLETERRTAIRQTVPTKASVEAETSTIVNERLFFNEFHFELASVMLLFIRAFVNDCYASVLPNAVLSVYAVVNSLLSSVITRILSLPGVAVILHSSFFRSKCRY